MFWLVTTVAEGVLVTAWWDVKTQSVIWQRIEGVGNAEAVCNVDGVSFIWIASKEVAECVAVEIGLGEGT